MTRELMGQQEENRRKAKNGWQNYGQQNSRDRPAAGPKSNEERRKTRKDNRKVSEYHNIAKYLKLRFSDSLLNKFEKNCRKPGQSRTNGETNRCSNENDLPNVGGQCGTQEFAKAFHSITN